VTSLAAIRRRSGFTLVEVVVFMVIVGVAAFALLRSFGSVLPRGFTAAQITQASQLAQERMELILGQRAAFGYAGNSTQLDPCKNVGPPAICTATFGYAVTSLGTGTALSVPTDPPVAWNANPVANYKVVTVTVGLSGTQLAQETVVLANY
jgi:type II secretory pathway pseudopilin PulG